MATAQGSLQVDDTPIAVRRRYTIVEGSGRIASGGLLEADLPRPSATAARKLLLRSPDIGTASRIAAVVDSVIGKGTAVVEDPGSVALTLKDGEASAQLAAIGALRVEPTRNARIVIDTRQGTVVAGGDLPLGPAIVSVAGITLTIGRVSGDSTSKDDPSAVRLAAGATCRTWRPRYRRFTRRPHRWRRFSRRSVRPVQSQRRSSRDDAGSSHWVARHQGHIDRRNQIEEGRSSARRRLCNSALQGDA
jgi:hypothetical protein